MTPEGWTETRFGNAFAKRTERGKAGLPTMSVTINDGLVFRDSIDRKMDTNLLAEEHLLVRKGDIAYNMMRMWQGASGLAEADALVSPAYVVLRPTAAIDPLFAAYLFKHPRTIYLFWAYSYGLTEDRLRLYFDDFSLIPICLPPIPEQRKIAEILTTWDHAIGKVEAQIGNARDQKQALIQKLLTQKARLPGFSGDWKRVAFGNLASLVKEKVDAQTLPDGALGIELEHIEAESGALLGTCQANVQVSLKTPFSSSHVLYGKLRPYLRKFVKPGFDGVCSTEIWALAANPKICLADYLLLVVQTSTFASAVEVSSGSKMPRADWGIVRDTPFMMPPIDEQSAIVDFISASEREVRIYEGQLAALRGEKHALMQQLLTGRRRVKVEKREMA